ncbi:DUF6470 family protein [Brevibacillus sp. TJ4]|uniref:DUF6470 family protein n=1 Tax=Brevibacillus sp. TJ4 TaxID=3234853 RepID=UPI0037D90802
MPISQLRMESTFARLGLNIQKPVQEIRQPNAEMNLQQTPAELSIEQARPILEIDSSNARANIGLMTSMQFSDKNASFGKEQWLQAIAEKSQEGRQLRAIHTKQNAIKAIAQQNTMRLLQRGTPSFSSSGDEGVDIHIRVKPVVIDVKRNGMSMNPVTRPPELSYTPGKVEPYMIQYNSLKIEVVGGQLDRTM